MSVEEALKILFTEATSDERTYTLEQIKEARETIQFFDKALKIIVEKKVNIHAIIHSCSLDNYHWLMDSYESDFINEEEYNLIKSKVMSLDDDEE